MSSLPDLSAVRANLAFTCTREADHLPALAHDPDVLFQYGRYLEKRDGPKNYDDVVRYYRIAAEYGHYKANHNLQLLVSQGLASSPDPEKESVDLAMQLVKAGIPSGYYDIGHYLLNGYGLKQDEDAARRYIRKAADLGNADAQFYIAELLNPADMAPDVARQMYMCATEQGHADAANSLGTILQVERRFAEAAQAFQKSAKAGSGHAAFSLSSAFDPKEGRLMLYDLGVPPDPERSRRYELIEKFLGSHESRNPKMPDLDKIVPLPPAPLPHWDGTFQWEKEQAAALPPEKPSDELIDRLAKEKHLDPATGLPLPGGPTKTSGREPTQTSEQAAAADIAGRLPLGTIALTGDACPESGVWCATLGDGQANDKQRRFAKGDTLPSLVIQTPRKFAIADRLMGAREHEQKVAWQLIAYIDQA